MTTLICDIEADGLLQDVSQIHVICIKDVDDVNVHVYHNNPALNRHGDLQCAVDKLVAADRVVFHNGICYDLPVLGKFFGKSVQTNLRGKILDTYVLSQMLYANEMKKHRLESWGEYFGQPKPKHEDWTILTQDMIYRCEQDTLITEKLFLKCEKELAKGDYAFAIKLETRVLEIFNTHQFGVCVDKEKAEHTLKKLEKYLSICNTHLIREMPTHIKKDDEPFSRLTTKDGNLTHHIINWCEKNDISTDSIGGFFSRLKVVEPNPNSAPQLVSWLLSLGWRPDEYNYQKDKRGRIVKDKNNQPIVTSPTTSKSEFHGVPKGIAKVLRRRNIAEHRRRVVAGWFKHLTKSANGLIATAGYTCGTNTARFRHAIVANVPSVDSFLGKTMRSCIKARDGYVFVGVDAAQLEARIQGHYTSKYDGGEYADFLLNQDIHSHNAKIFGCTRSEAKSPGYALDYGCSPYKLVQILGCSEKQAKKYWNDYWDSRPAAKQFKDELIAEVASQGYAQGEDIYYARTGIRTIDKRKIFVRSWHSLVNAKVQSTGSLCMKVAYCWLATKLENLGLDARIAIFYHDEFQIECRPEDVKIVKDLALKSISTAGEYFKLNIELVGDAKVGRNWGETH